MEGKPGVKGCAELGVCFGEAGGDEVPSFGDEGEGVDGGCGCGGRGSEGGDEIGFIGGRTGADGFGGDGVEVELLEDVCAELVGVEFDAVPVEDEGAVCGFFRVGVHIDCGEVAPEFAVVASGECDLAQGAAPCHGTGETEEEAGDEAPDRDGGDEKEIPGFGGLIREGVWGLEAAVGDLLQSGAGLGKPCGPGAGNGAGDLVEGGIGGEGRCGFPVEAEVGEC